MKITIGRLRKLIAEAAMDQMNLGITSANSSARDFGLSEEPEDDDNLEIGDHPLILTEPPPNLNQMSQPDKLGNPTSKDRLKLVLKNLGTWIRISGSSMTVPLAIHVVKLNLFPFLLHHIHEKSSNHFLCTQN